MAPGLQQLSFTRRQLGLVGGAAMATPALGQGRSAGVSPLSHGARGDGRADDTEAVKAALSAAIDQGVPLIVDAPFRLRPGDTARFHYDPDGTRVPLFDCIPLRASGLTIRGAGGRFLIGDAGRSWPPGARCYMFLSDKNRDDNALRNVTFEGVHFDFDNRASQSVPSPYAVGLYGATGVTFSDCRWTNDTAPRRRGWGASLLNCRDVTFAGCFWSNVTQGLNARYAFGFTFRDCAWHGVFEAVDFDGVVRGLRGRNLEFRACGQCLDLSGAVDVEITDVTSDSCRNLAQIYDKPTTQRLFADWLVGRPMADPPDYVTSAGVALRRIRSRARPEETGGTWLQVGIQRRTQWSTAGRPPPVGISFEDASSEFAGSLLIHEGEVTLRRVQLRGAPGPAAIQAEAQPGRGAADSFLDLTLQDVQLTDSAGAGLLARRPRRVRIASPVVIHGYGQAAGPNSDASFGVSISDGGQPPGGTEISIAGLSVMGAPHPGRGEGPTDLLIQAAGSDPRIRVAWGDDIRLAGAQPLRLVGPGLPAAFASPRHETVSLAQLAASAGQLCRAEGRGLLIPPPSLRLEIAEPTALDWFLLRRHDGKPDEVLGQGRSMALPRGDVLLASEGGRREASLLRLPPGEALVLILRAPASNHPLRGSVTFLPLPFTNH